MKKRLIFFCFIRFLAAETPESKIVVIDQFISSEVSQALIQYYNMEKQNLDVNSDNQIAFSSISNPHIRKLISDISDQVLTLMKQSYGIKKAKYRLDHAGLYARIPGNSCGYHADNIRFYCPIHGSDQGKLRTTCKGDCPGAQYVPNHTHLREYTALIYLNDDFQGGEILFEDGPCNKIYRKIIPIRSNLLVLAPNGKDFYHEVFQIRSGRRYSLHIWYTRNN